MCNDGYAKALYSMKDLCVKIKVEAASTKLIDDRMVEILRYEGIRDMSNSVRSVVIKQACGDARSAITRVQMIA